MFAVPAVASTTPVPKDTPSSTSKPKDDQPEATVESATVTRSAIADEKKGVKFSASGFTGDKTATVTVRGTDGTEYHVDTKLTVNDKGEVNGTYFFTLKDGADVPLGKYSLWVTGTETKKKSSEASFDVVADGSEPTPSATPTAPSATPTAPSATPTAPSATPTAPSATPTAPSATPTPSETTAPQPKLGEIKAAATDITQSKFQSTGLGFNGTGFTAGTTATVTVAKKSEAGKPLSAPTEVTADKDGKLAFTVKGAGATQPGTAANRSAALPKAEVPTAPAPTDRNSTLPGQPATTLEIPAAPGAYTVEVKVAGIDTSAKVDFEVTADPAPTTSAPAPTTSAPAPTTSAPAAPTESAKPTETGKPSQSPVPTGKPSESADEQAAPKLTIDPLEISSADFGKEGVKILGEHFAPGEKVTLVVTHAQGKVKRYTKEVTADDNGVAAYRVRAETSPVLGQYNVTVHPSSASATGEKALNGSFTVITNGSSVGDETGTDGKASDGSTGSGSNSKGSGSSSSSDLPRTGAELTGLAMGAGLLVIGAAAVVITRRRTAGGNDPADI